MKKPLLGLAMMPEAEFVSAILPLLQNNDVDVLEWSFDTLYDVKEPEWLSGLLDFYAENNRLLGHGVYYSLFDARWTERQESWLKKLKKEFKHRKYNHITEHFGFMNTENFHQGVPLPVPLHSKTLQIGKDRLCRLQDAVEIPVGIENLAFSFSVDDVKEQGEFLAELIEDIDGFLILDLHNIYCQSCNFEIDMQDIIRMYPLEKVKEIHLSGGSWQESAYGKKPVRRDTHDDNIPEVILNVLPEVLAQCNNLEYIIIERLGHTLDTEAKKHVFFDDFYRVKAIIDISDFSAGSNKVWNKKNKGYSGPVEDLLLYDEQTKLTKMLFEGNSVQAVKNEKFHYFKPENWDEEMIATAQQIIKKWNPY
ncbi:DUF692 family multinuclear iron-containing protein [Chryseobacterium shigense]|uniref:Uncharacterized protein (UPF0276 family) n=1 Tax=Chryseobacterium shigense TaxID=297244 RepID=A0A841N8G1_9FLAO|nr:DUF692 family multinuclear iron-containing protein [Chryseobacterium shigense]MBB6369710.1 uncharacterized protein (UPF0276 family) [Chryseobacterium shigense]